MQFFKINLYKQRELGDLVNITFAFIRQNAKSLFKAHVAINLPIMLVLVFLTLAVQYVTGFDFQKQLSAGAADGFLGDMTYISNIVFSSISGLVFYVTLGLVNTVYMHLYLQHGNETFPQIEPAQVWEGVKRYFASSIGGVLLYGIAIALGFVLCFLPGVFVLVAFWLFQSSIVFEKTDGVSSLSRSYDLVKNNWWITFGFLIVMGILSGILAAIINAPTYIFTFFAAFHFIEDGSMDSLNLAPYVWVLISLFTTVLGYLGSFVSYTITQIAANYHFGNLVEQKEARGLTAVINQTMDDNASEAI